MREERLIWDQTCAEYGVKSIEKAGGGYARGCTHALTHWREFLSRPDAEAPRRHADEVAAGEAPQREQAMWRDAHGIVVRRHERGHQAAGHRLNVILKDAWHVLPRPQGS